jgi:hypothetical protein
VSGSESEQQPAGQSDGDGTTAGSTAALGEEAVLNAAVAFAGHAVQAAQEAAAPAAASAGTPLGEAVFRQYLLETATLCLRRLSESYAAAASDGAHADVAELVRDGAARAGEAMATVETLGDLSLDILDRLLGE